MKVLVTSRLFGSEALGQVRRLYEHGFELIYHPQRGVPLRESVLLANRALLEDIDAIVCGDDEITETVINAAPRLRVICKHGVGVDKIALQAASARSILVCNAPASNATAVAEFTVGLMLALLRRILWVDGEVKRGNFPALIGRQLSDCTVGIVGLGQIGQAVVRRLRAFGCPILVYDPYVANHEVWGAPVTLDELWRSSDVITFHVPLTSETFHLVTSGVLAQMKPDAQLINTARAALFDFPAVLAWLDAHPEAGAALDTFQKEPPGEVPLTGPNVVLTSHIAGLTRGFLEQAAALTVQALIDVTEGRIPATAIKGTE